MANKTYDYKAFIAVYMNTIGYEKSHADWKAYYVEYYVRVFDILKGFFNARFDMIEFFAQSQDLDDKRIGALTLFKRTMGEYIDCFRPKSVALAVPNGYSELQAIHFQKVAQLRTDLKTAYL